MIDGLVFFFIPENIEARHLGRIKERATLCVGEVRRTGDHHVIHLIVANVIIARMTMTLPAKW